MSVAISGCDWVGYQGGADHAGVQPLEMTINSSNVSGLHLLRTYPFGSGVPRQGPRVANGRLYTVSGGTFEVFDARSCAAPCAAQWSGSAAYNAGLLVAGGFVYSTDGNALYAFDAAGSDGCTTTVSGTVCTPVWKTSTNIATGPAVRLQGTPVLANGVLYVAGLGDGLPAQQGGSWVYAFDPAGTSVRCGGRDGSIRVCTPEWYTTTVPTSEVSLGVPAVANGVVYLTSPAPSLLAFDSAGCASSPCAPLWTATPPRRGATQDVPSDAPVVAGGRVLFPTVNGPLYAYNAAGCGSSSCPTPLWSATNAARSVPAVSNGVVYSLWANGVLHASALDSGAALWSSSPAVGETGGSSGSGSPVVANGVVFAGKSGYVFAYDAGGCGQSTCAERWHGADCTNNGGYLGDLAVWSGTVYIGCGGSTYAYGL